ncbi:Centromere protein C-like protein [Drosera capensis]
MITMTTTLQFQIPIINSASSSSRSPLNTLPSLHFLFPRVSISSPKPDALVPMAAPFSDPLAGYSILSLFPRTFGSSSLVVNNSDDDVDAIHFHLKALELRNPEKLLDQAKRVVDSNTGSTGTTDDDDAVSKIYKDKGEVVAAEGAENPRRRRPGLGRRRAQFSLLSDASERAENIKPGQNIDISEDPDEYFARLDRLEKAERELQRQRGIALMDLDQNAPLVNARRRGPSLLGS